MQYDRTRIKQVYALRHPLYYCLHFSYFIYEKYCKISVSHLVDFINA